MNQEKLYVILIVDDNPDNIRVLFNFLKSSSFRVLVSKSGEDALRKLKKVTPDLILLDAMMPQIDGFEVCRRLKENPETQEIPIIFMTALAETEQKVQGFALGGVDYITKPLQREEVLTRVRLHLKLNELTHNLQENNRHLTEEIAVRIAIELELKRLNQQLDALVKERTQYLFQALKQLELREKELSYEATHDSLTGLFNRPWLLHFLSKIIEEYQQKNKDYSILFLDLDRFKKINDRFGHLAGDELLKDVAFRLKSCLYSTEKIARLSGDEFLIIVQKQERVNQSEQLIRTIFNQLKNPFYLENNQLFIGASIGVIPTLCGYQKPTDILRDADIAVYKAKQIGRGCHVILTPEMQSQALERVQLESDLRRGIEEKQFCLYYQPIFSLKTQQLVGFEALIRWQHPRLGIVSPGVFIEVAEEMEAIAEIDGLAFQMACEQIQIWQKFDREKIPVININCSVQKLQQTEIVEQVVTILKFYGISPSVIKLEVTESGFLKAASQAINQLRQIQNLGIKLCIDDFGTGYSSLSRLHSFPLNTVKIDRSFVIRLTNNREGETIVQTIISLAHNLNMDVVAEGIETQEQLNKLIELGCEFGQGYLFSKPLPGQQATQLLTERFYLTG